MIPEPHPGPFTGAPSPAHLYLDLLKRCLVNAIYPDAETAAVPPEAVLGPEVATLLAQRGLSLVRPCPADGHARAVAATGRRSPTAWSGWRGWTTSRRASRTCSPAASPVTCWRPASGAAAAPVDRLAVLRLDGDLYESTWEALVSLYPKVSPGGYLIIDDYQDIAACRQAVDDYRRAQGITEDIIPIDWTGVYWRRR